MTTKEMRYNVRKWYVVCNANNIGSHYPSIQIKKDNI
jgi:hypothetical protein